MITKFATSDTNDIFITEIDLISRKIYVVFTWHIYIIMICSYVDHCNTYMAYLHCDDLQLRRSVHTC